MNAAPTTPGSPSRHRPGRIIATRLPAIAAVAAILGVAATGCGTSTGTGAQSSTATTSSSPPAAATSSALPSAAQLESALLTPGDLGTGFTTEPPTAGSGTSDNATTSDCQGIENLVNGTPGVQETEQESDLTGGQTGPFVEEILLTEPTHALAQDYARDEAALTSCTTLTISEDATTLTLTLSPIHFGGPGTTSVRMDGTLDGIQVNGYIAIDRLGSVELGYIYFQLESGSSQLASDYFTLAVAKAHSALGSLAGPVATS
jgi:hypothetical protein